MHSSQWVIINAMLSQPQPMSTLVSQLSFLMWLMLAPLSIVALSGDRAQIWSQLLRVDLILILILILILSPKASRHLARRHHGRLGPMWGAMTINV